MAPLSGVRVLSIEHYGAGPYGTQLLADLGAEVVKVENGATGGDYSRSVGPYLLGEGDSQFHQTFSRGKKERQPRFEVRHRAHPLRAPAC